MTNLYQLIVSHFVTYADGISGLGLNGLLGKGNVQNGAIQTDPNSLNTILANIITLVLSIAGLVAFVMVIYAGFTYLTSSGEDSKLERSKKTLTTAVIGLVIIAFSYFVTQALMSILGLPSYFSFGSILSALGI